VKIAKSTWAIFIAAAIACGACWFSFSYPQFSSANFSVNRSQALAIAKNYLSENYSLEASNYKTAVIFYVDTDADRYLQKSLGFKEEQKFISEHQFDLFLWAVRFFKENEKEEFRFAVSAATGEIASFTRFISDTEYRDPTTEETAKKRAIQFLKEKFNFEEGNYTVHQSREQKYDHRTDYGFSWEKNDVYVPWGKEPGLGGAKLLIGATISGNEVLSFTKNQLEIPEKFSRHIKRQQHTGENLSVLFTIFYIALLTASTFLVVLRRNHAALSTTKNFFIASAVILFFLSLFDFLNNLQALLFQYQTTASLSSYFWQYSFGFLVKIFFIAIAILMPGLAGESLRHEIYPKKIQGSFSHYLLSTFWSRSVFSLIILGYLAAIIMAGIQSSAFHLGQKYLGVWIERTWLTQLSTAYWPFFSALAIAFRASIVEEITFRIFAIHWIKKITGNIFLAVILASTIWGFGHTLYPVFPMWFRGIEVALMGLFLSYVYLNFGIIPVLVAHYVFDVFWGSADFLLGKSQPVDFYSSLAILALPLLLGIAALILNKEERERAIVWRLNKHQLYNLGVLKTFLENNSTPKPSEEIRQELITHGWDAVVIEKALESVKK